MSTVEILEELSSKIAEVYDLELAKEFTEIYENLADHIYEDADEHFELTKKLAEMEIKKDRYKEEYGRIYNEYKRVKGAFEFAREEYKKLLRFAMRMLIAYRRNASQARKQIARLNVSKAN